MENELVWYKMRLEPTWTYGVQLWGTESNFGIEIVQNFQSKTLSNVCTLLYYNDVTHLAIPLVKYEIIRYSKRRTSRFRRKLSDPFRRKRYTPLNLVIDSPDD